MHHALRYAGAAVALSCVLRAAAQAQPEPSAPPPEAAAPWQAVTIVEGIRHPWGLAWLPDGRPLITAKHGTLHTVQDGTLREIPLEGLPAVFSEGQGALMDIAVHPDDAESKRPRLYMTMAAGTRQANRTILVRGTFDGERVREIATLFEVEPPKSGSAHFGSRLLWLPDGTLLMSVGDGGNPPQRIGGMLARDQAQNLGSHLGSIVRLTAEGRAAPDNPFGDRDGALPEIWSYGHRNIQGLARDPASGRIWANEHGPLGGDELNLVEGGKNHGWPLQTLGRDYRTGQSIGESSVEGMEQPLVVWTPATAPSGLAYYTGLHFPAWRGSLFSGGLVSKDVRRVILDGEGRVTGQERLSIDSRVRDVRQGPDGHLYVLTDERNGRLLRIEPGD